jgi:hypothetical protein
MRRWILFLIVFTGAAIVGADGEFQPPAATNQPSLLARLGNADGWNNWHGRMSSNVTATARYLDNYFADDKLEEESNGTRVKLSLGVSYRQKDDEVKAITRANVRLQLPMTSERLKLVFEDLVESDDADRPSAIIDDVGDSRPDAALRYQLRKKKRYDLDLDAGVRSSSQQVFLRLRGDRRFEVSDKLKFRLTESVRWFSKDGWVSLTQFDIDKLVDGDMLLRSRSELEWAEEERGVRPSQTFSLYKPFSRQRAIRWDIGGVWPESPGPEETRYYTSLTYRRLVFSDWIFLEITPGVEFPQTHDYEAKFFGSIKFDFIFGDTQ